MKARHFVREDQKVMLVALAILHLIAQQCLGTKAHPLKNLDSALLVDRHLRDYLLDAQPERDCESLLRKQAAEALAAHFGGNQDAKLRHMRRPRQLAAIHRRIALHLAAGFSKNAEDASARDAAQPYVDRLGLGNIAAEKEQIVSRERARKGERHRAVVAAHLAQRDARAFEIDLARIVAGIFVFHIDRSESHRSSSGHNRRTALGPATKLTCPPLSTMSFLSVLPIRLMTSLADSNGTMWSCSAITARKATMIFLKST